MKINNNQIDALARKLATKLNEKRNLEISEAKKDKKLIDRANKAIKELKGLSDDALILVKNYYSSSKSINIDQAVNALYKEDKDITPYSSCHDTRDQVLIASIDSADYTELSRMLDL